MTTIDASRPDEAPRPTLRARLGGRRGLLIAGLVLTGAAMALNWSWLAAIGAAPLIIAFAPCAVMCGLGLCMKGGSGKSCSSGATESAAARTPGPDNE